MKYKICLFLTLVNWITYSSNKIWVISIPKSGTHLLCQCIKFLTGKNQQWVTSVSNELPKNFNWDRHIATSHAPATPDAIEYCKKNNIKVIFIHRDPRDIAVSAACYLKNEPYAKKYNKNEFLSECIINHVRWFRWWKNSDFSFEYTVADYYPMYMEWSKYPFVYTTTFEKLVGERGGGSSEKQLQEISSIVNFLQLENKQMQLIIKKLFGNSQSFRAGKIGSWKEHFTEEHKGLFKKIAGKLLINLGYEQDLNW